MSIHFTLVGCDNGKAYKQEFRSRIDPAINPSNWTELGFNDSRSFHDDTQEGIQTKQVTSKSIEKTSQPDIVLGSSSVGRDRVNTDNPCFHDNNSDDSASNHDDCDTWVFPLIQMNQFGINIDEGVTQRLWRDASEQTQIFLASGYLNFPVHYENVILKECSAIFNIVTAHPKVKKICFFLQMSCRKVIYEVHNVDKYTPVCSCKWNLVQLMY